MHNFWQKKKTTEKILFSCVLYWTTKETNNNDLDAISNYFIFSVQFWCDHFESNLYFVFFLNMILFHWKILNIITRVTIQNFIFGWKKNSQNFDISKFLKITKFLGKRYILYYKYHKLMAWKTDISGEFFKKNSNVGVFLLLFSIVVNLKSSQPWILKLKGIFIC